jgi:hypothetical protein
MISNFECQKSGALAIGLSDREDREVERDLANDLDATTASANYWLGRRGNCDGG